MCFELPSKSISKLGKIVFKKGDKVKLLRSAKSGENGWDNAWISSMTGAVGKIGTVVSAGVIPHDIRVEFPDMSNSYGYPDFVLEKIEPKKVESKPVLRPDYALAAIFKKGDIVRAHFDYPSVNEGKTGEVVEVAHGYVRVRFDDGHQHSLYPQRLTLVESKASVTGVEEIDHLKHPVKVTHVRELGLSDFSVGDRVQIHYGFGWDGWGTVRKIGRIYVIVKPDHKNISGYFLPNQLTKLAAVTNYQTRKTIRSGNEAYLAALTAAVVLAKQNGVTNADEVQAEISKQGITPAKLGNAAGAVFRSKHFTKVGSIKSARPGNNSRTISTWKYVGA